jgi:glycosidase
MENSYHGYAQIDFTILDERFGTLEEFRNLVSEAHKRDIKVIVDMVVNHMADLYYFDGYPNGKAPFHLHSGEYKYIQRTERKYSDFVVNNTFYQEGKYGTLYNDGGYPVNDQGSGSFWESDFHHNGDLHEYSDVYQNHLGKIYGIMDDLRTTHPRVQNKIIAMTNALISSVDIDGIRMDTPMQVPLEFFKRWSSKVKEHAKSLGKSNFYIFGEFYCSRERASTMTGRGKTPAMYGKDEFIDNVISHDGGIHYPLYQWFMTTIKDHSNDLDGIKRALDQDLVKYDWNHPNFNENRYRHVHFFNNHDQWRMSSSEFGFQKSILSTAIIALWPGIPAHYYGDEQGFLTKGTALDGYSREDMMTSLAWKDKPTVDGKNPCEIDNFDMANQYFLWTRMLYNVRRIYPAFWQTDKVQERWKQTGNSNGIYSYSKILGEPENWVLVVWNTWKQTLFAGEPVGEFYTGWKAGQVIVNVFDEKERITLGKDGTIQQLGMYPFSTKVFVLEQSLKPLDLFVNKASPSHDSVVVANSRITISFSEKLNWESFQGKVILNNQPISFDHDENSLWIPSTSLKIGVNKLKIDSSVKSVRGTHLSGNYIVRYRKGNQENIIVNPKFTYDPDMIMSVVGNQFYIRHRALGAKYLRIKLNDDEFLTGWTDFQEVSIVRSDNMKKITVQYWVDDSAAYFVSTNYGGKK